MHVLLAVRDGANPAIHRDAGESIGVEARDFLFALQPLDHAHRGRIHGLVQIRILRVRNIVFRRLLGRAFHILPAPPILGIEAVNALLDVDDLRHAAVGYGLHESCGLIGGNVALLGEKFERLRLGLIPRLVQILIKTHGDPRCFGLDAREVERPAFDHLEREVEFLIGGFDRRQVDFAIALRGMGIARPQ